MNFNLEKDFKQPEISVIVTIYNASESISELHSRVLESLLSTKKSFEIVYVEDRSKDNSWDLLLNISKSDERVKCIRFIRNFGQHAGISAGLHHVTGKYVVMMDGDLQDEPEIIPDIYKKIVEVNKPIVFVRRMGRQDGVFKRLSSRFFYSFFSFMSGIRSDSSIGSFRIMEFGVVRSFRELPETNKFIGGLFYWMNFDHEFFDTPHQDRKYGKSNYTFSKMLNLAMKGIISFSTKPLKMGIYLGIGAALFSFLLGSYFIYRKLVLNVTITGYSSLIVSIYFMGGLNLLVLGILGRYLGEVHHQTKRRPDYIIDETVNLK